MPDVDEDLRDDRDQEGQELTPAAVDEEQEETAFVAPVITRPKGLGNTMKLSL